MSSTILYKFRSGATFEALPLPGSAARLFDIKKAIVVAKKLDSGGSMEFDLAIKDATTNQEYTDDTMLLPRGTRIIVHRLPAARGYGIMSKIARSQYGGGIPSGSAAQQPQAAPSNFYTIESRPQDDDDEFVSSSSSTNANNNSNPPADQDNKELAALQAATAGSGSNIPGLGRGSRPPGFPGGGGSSRFGPSVAGAGGPGVAGGGAPQHGGPPRHPRQQRPNADPELREKTANTRRATGIPRTFLNLSATPVADGTNDKETSNVQVLKPNAIGFQELVSRGGGQSENASGTKRDLEYAIKVTATPVPDYLQCAICHNVVKDAMMLPWDPEGRTTCESCIRDALTQSGFRCPLTGQEGVSPDDLLPNHALRKAAERFVKDVMDKMEEIVQQVDDDAPDGAVDGDSGAGKPKSNTEGDVVLTKRETPAERKKKEQDDDPFGGGDDDFGGDVFAVEGKKNDDAAAEGTEEKATTKENAALESNADKQDATKADAEEKNSEPELAAESKPNDSDEMQPPGSPNNSDAKGIVEAMDQPVSSSSTGAKSPSESNSARRENNRRRGPPVGYSMGPAGGAAAVPQQDGPGGRGPRVHPREGGAKYGYDQYERPFYPGRRGGGRYGRGRGRGGGREYDHRRRYENSDGPGSRERNGEGDDSDANEADGRGTKRSRPSDDGSAGGDGRGGGGGSHHPPYHYESPPYHDPRYSGRDEYRGPPPPNGYMPPPYPYGYDHPMAYPPPPPPSAMMHPHAHPPPPPPPSSRGGGRGRYGGGPYMPRGGGRGDRGRGSRAPYRGGGRGFYRGGRGGR